MTIDERCYGYEPAQSQLNEMRVLIKRYERKIEQQKDELADMADLRRKLNDDIKRLQGLAEDSE